MQYEKVDPKQSLPKIEAEILKFWKENKIFEKSIETRPEENPYRFYDGPPFITGKPHYGHILVGAIKDVVPRYWTMKGKRIERIWGWDCHGIPIEEKVQKKLKIESNKEIEKVGVKKFIDECYNYTRATSAEWEWYVEKTGRWVDFQNSYKTMDQTYMETVMRVFKQLYDKGLVYKGKRVSLYSWKLGTPISNFEVAMDNSYVEAHDPAITVMFDLSENKNGWEDTYALAWTTTPWTIPANMALAVNKDCKYIKVRSNGKKYILTENRVVDVFKDMEYEILEYVEGKNLVGLSYKPPFDYYKGNIEPDKNHRIYHAEFVTDEDGTGIAHEAPEFGDVDFVLAKEEGIYISEALDEEAKYTAQITDMKGVFYQDANNLVIEKLTSKGLLFKKASITHRVPVCPRTDTYLIQKAQDSRFLDVQSIKDKLFQNNEKINWFPEHFKHGRFAKNIEAAPDWCISRTRYWATPMPIWIGYDDKGIQQDIKVYGSKEEIENASGMKITDLHKPYIDDITWEENGLTYKRVSEVLDVWLDSGSMPYAQVHYPFENKEKFEASFPADFIVEYVGQIRAWFYVMHVVATALFDKPSYTNVITTGVLFGNDGRKMSKSLGNFPDPKDTIIKHGGDGIRMYLVNSPLVSGGDMNFLESGLEEVIKKLLLPLWNTYYFFVTYASIDNFEPADKYQGSDNQLDRWIISELNTLVKDVNEAMEKYDLQGGARPMFQFIDNLTNWYIRRSRRRFWKTENDQDKMQGYNTLYYILVEFCKVLAPYCPFITEHIFKNLTGKESVHLEFYPEYDSNLIDKQLNNDMYRSQKFINLGLNIRTKNKIRVRQPLASATISEQLDDYYLDIIKEELNVKEVIVSQEIEKIAKKVCKPNAKILGPKYGKVVQNIITEAKAGNFEEIENGKVKVLGYTLEADEYEIVLEKSEDNGEIGAGFGLVISMDVKLSEELKLEGYARDIVRSIQEARKEAGYNVDDRIQLEINGENVQPILDKFSNYIQAETLSTITNNITNPNIEKQLEINELKINFKLLK